MKLKQRIDIVDLTKRGILVNRVDVVNHIMRGIVKRFGLEITYAYLNPVFNELTDYIIVGYSSRDNKIVIFHAVSFGECSTAQFDLYAANKNLDEFYQNMMNNATCYPERVFDALMVQHGLSLNKGDPMYWRNTDKNVAKLVIDAFEELSPAMSHAKRVRANSGRR